MGAYDPPQSLLPIGQTVSTNTQSDSKSAASTRSTTQQIQRSSSFLEERAAIPLSQIVDSSLKDDTSSVSSQPVLLPFSTLGLVGRTKEKQTLQEVVDAIVPRTQQESSTTQTPPSALAAPQHTLALISGPSGSGKSALTMHFQQQCFDRRAFFVNGKFDLKQMEEPYSGIKAALGNMCRQMLALQQASETNGSSSVYSSGSSADESLGEDPRSFSELQKLLVNGLSANEVQALSKVLPEITSLVELSEQEQTRSGHQRSPSMASNASVVESQHVQDSSRIGYREQSDRLKFALRRFMQIACQFCPVVMVIDDLQWGDKPSMDLLQSWMLMDAGDNRTDSNKAPQAHHSLLIMGCFRSEVSEHSPILQDSIEELKSAQEARSINIVEVSLGDMKVSQVHELVCGLLLPTQCISSDASVEHSVGSSTNSSSKSPSPVIIGGHETLALAHLVHKRTIGNVFFVKQFLQQLCRDGLIYYDQMEHRWSWKSEAEILEKSAVTTNIVDLMKVKMVQIQAARQILPIAACLGATFSTSKLMMVIRSLTIHSDHSKFFRNIFDIPRHLTDSWVSDILRSCEREGLIESFRESTNMRQKKATKRAKRRASRARAHQDMYSFVHDKVQEASFSLIPVDSVTELQYRVGEALSSCLTPSQLEDSIFMVASLLNLRHDLVPHSNRGDRRMKIAMLNNMAGERAVSCGAFQSALSYFKTAISLLPDDHWESQLENSLNLYSSVAECCYVTSDMDQMHAYATQVINQDCPMLDKIRAYHILIDAGTTEVENNRGADPLSLCLFVLAELGCKFPQNKMLQGMATLRGMLKMKRCVPKWSLRQFDDLPVCTDPKELAITKTLSRLSTVAYMANPDLVPLVVVKLVQRTIDHGISQHSLPSFSLLGMIIGYFMGDFQASRKLGKISLRLAGQVDCQETKAMTILLANLMCLHWTNPIEEGRQAYLECYRAGMANGEIEPAAWGLYYSISTHLFTGTPLPMIKDDLSRYAKLAKDFHQTNPYHGCSMLLQMVHNLQGETENRTLLVGEAYNEEEELQRLELQPDPQRVVVMQTMNMQAAVYFGDFAVGAKIGADTYEVRLKTHAGTVGLPPAIFNSGMCCYAICSSKAAPSKLLKKYLKTAKKCRAKLREWQEKGNPNCGHYVALLNAEHCALKGKHESAIKNYAIAIALTKSRNYIQDEALVYERLAEHLMKGDPSHRSKAQQCMRRAIELTEEWGATAKVADLREKYADFLQGSPNSFSSFL